MTAVLDELRRLDAARQRGDITDREFAQIRTRLETAVEDAAFETDAATDAAAEPSAKLWHICLFILAAFGAVTVIVSFAIGDLTLAMTLGATLLAALSVHASQTLGD